MLTDLEWVLRRLHAVTTSRTISDKDKLELVYQYVHSWANEISFDLECEEVKS
jgi:hypothetical protein